MTKVTYTTRFSSMVREFDTLPEAERYAGVNIMITGLTVDGKVII
jgi:hypothetical protein